MATNPSEQENLARSHRLRRWTIRICLLLLLIVLILTISCFVLLSPSGMTATEAEAAFAQMKPQSSREEAVRLLGKPTTEETSHGVTTLSWQYYTHGLNHVDVFYCTQTRDQQGLLRSSNSIKAKIEGGEVWRWRWNKLKQRLGMK
ncbi:MAG: hypothetical protein QM703_01250 [Gemmatales bacterium]